MLRRSYRTEIGDHLLLAYPVMLSQLGHVLMGLADNIMVGRLGPTSLAAVGFANIAFNVLLLFGIGVSYAISPLVAEARGRGATGDVISVVRHGLLVNVLNALLLVACVKGARELLYFLGQPPEVVDLAIPYLDIVTWSLVPALIFQTFRQFSEGMAQTWVPMAVVLGANVINIGLNACLIYGYGGFPAMGLVGAGYATFVSRVLMALALMAVVHQLRFFRAYRAVFLWTAFQWQMIRKILKIGIPSGLMFIFEVAAFDFSLVMMGWLGTTALAAHQIAINLATLSYMTVTGIATAGTIRVGFAFGERNGEAVQRAGRLTLLLAAGFMSIFAVLFIALRHLLPFIYIADADTVALASQLLIVAGLFQLSDGLQVAAMGALRGLQDVKIPSLLIFIAYWAVGLPLGYVLAFPLGGGPTGIWIGLLVGLTLTAAAAILRLGYFSRKVMRMFAP